MRTLLINLGTVDKVKKFVNIVSKYEYDFDLVSGRYVIDAKSIMGIFSIDLSKNITLNIHAEDKNLDNIMKELDSFVVK